MRIVAGFNRNLFYLAMCQAMMMTSNVLVVTTNALIGLTLAPSPQWATLAFACQFLLTMVCAYPASHLMMKFGRKPVFLGGVAIALLGALLSCLGLIFSSYILYCVGLGCLGIYNASAQYYRFAATEIASAKYKSRAIAWVLSGGVIAAVIGPSIAGLTRDVWEVGFLGSYNCLILIHALTALMLFLIRFPDAKPPRIIQEGNGRSLSEIIGNSHCLCAITAAVVGYGIMNLLMTATPMAMQILTLSYTEIVMVIQWHVFAMFVPSFFTGHLIYRFGSSRIILVGTFALVTSILINLSGHSFTHFGCSLIFLGIGWNFLYIGGTSLLTETYHPSEKSRVQGLNDTLVATATTTSALGSGFFFHYLGWDWLNLSSLPLIAILLLLLFQIRNRGLPSESKITS